MASSLSLGKRSVSTILVLCEADSSLRISECSTDPGPHIGWLSFYGKCHGSQVAPDHMQLVNQRHDDAKRIFVQIKTIGQIAQQLHAGDIDPVKDMGVAVECFAPDRQDHLGL
ncbi:MAG: hypothetical protein Q7J44_21105, partial [Pseudotabrizicola sp.]|uniref:hypothetical protein n=1 Tax=Pseudotabrizicola sp. TaxID=2939647 RepID=UPI00271AC500